MKRYIGKPRTQSQNQKIWALVQELATMISSREDAEMIMRDHVEAVTGQRSTRTLTAGQAGAVIDRMTLSLSAKSRPGRGRKRWENLADRNDFASPAQLRMLEALAADCLRGETVQARARSLRGVLKRMAGVDHLRFLRADQVTVVKRAIEAIGARNAVNDGEVNP